MTIDTLDAFEALRRHDIRVPRAKYVDSAEDAIAFAELRNAPDPRFLPIVLRIVDGALDDSSPPLPDEAAVRAAFLELRDHPTGRVLAQVATPPGTDLVMRGSVANGRKHITIEGELHGLPESTQAMIAHLRERVLAAYADPQITALRLTVRLHENGYTVVDTRMSSRGHLAIKARARRHARDRKGHYHTSGLQ